MKLSTGSDLIRVPVRRKPCFTCFILQTSFLNTTPNFTSSGMPMNADAHGLVTAHWIDTPQLDEGTEQEEANWTNIVVSQN